MSEESTRFEANRSPEPERPVRARLPGDAVSVFGLPCAAGERDVVMRLNAVEACEARGRADEKGGGLVQFLYILLRDEIPFGKVERILRDHVEKASGRANHYSEPNLERYARSIAARIRGEESSHADG